MEHTNYLTADEVGAAQTLHKLAPYSVANISTSIFSVSRHFGGMRFNGGGYTYMGNHYDECVRDDVLRLVTKRRKAGAKAATKAVLAQAEQMDLY